METEISEGWKLTPVGDIKTGDRLSHEDVIEWIVQTEDGWQFSIYNERLQQVTKRQYKPTDELLIMPPPTPTTFKFQFNGVEYKTPMEYAHKLTDPVVDEINTVIIPVSDGLIAYQSTVVWRRRDGSISGMSCLMRYEKHDIPPPDLPTFP